MVESKLMKLKSIIDNTIKNAFLAAGDLVVSAELIKRNTSNFNFGTGVYSDSNVNVPIRVIVGAAKKESPMTNSKTKTITFQDTVFDMKMYDRVILDAHTWLIKEEMINTGFTTILNIVLES
jgi:hypothetical protein